VQATVEDRILELQKKKRDLIDGALDEKASQSIGRLGIRELASLFVSQKAPCLITLGTDLLREYPRTTFRTTLAELMLGC
jgi:hypothetical protein